MHLGTLFLKQIVSHSLKWDAAPKIGSLDNASHVPGGGAKKVTD